jgi:hypothetical protein
MSSIILDMASEEKERQSVRGSTALRRHGEPD